MKERSSEPGEMAPLRTVIVSGLSGAGKSLALKVLEDIGFFCVDNLPLPLLEAFLEFRARSGEDLSRIAIGMDVRGRVDPAEYTEAFERLRRSGYALEVLFLDADDRILHARYRESRRPHPLEGVEVLDVIRLERVQLAPLRATADLVVDTSALNVHELRRRLIREFEPGATPAAFQITLLSFAYRFGVPFEADLVFDVRFLPNPHFVPGLRELDGRDDQVQGYIFEHEVSQEFLTRLESFLEFLLPHYRREGKTYLTIALGCTGGQHRSVALVETLRNHLSFQGIPLEVRHRDLPG